jgi:hypothetical protein
VGKVNNFGSLERVVHIVVLNLIQIQEKYNSRYVSEEGRREDGR